MTISNVRSQASSALWFFVFGISVIVHVVAANRFLSFYCAIHTALIVSHYICSWWWLLVFCFVTRSLNVNMCACVCVYIFVVSFIDSFRKIDTFHEFILTLVNISLSPFLYVLWCVSTHTCSIIKMPLDRRHLIISYHTQKMCCN